MFINCKYLKTITITSGSNGSKSECEFGPSQYGVNCDSNEDEFFGNLRSCSRRGHGSGLKVRKAQVLL